MVAHRSNQTPTYDRIPDSQDQWGEFYFIENPKTIASFSSVEFEKEASSSQSLSEKILERLDISAPEEEKGNLENIFLYRNEERVNAGEILEFEPITVHGARLSFEAHMDESPVLIQLNYSEGTKNRTDRVSYQGKTYDIPQSIRVVRFRLGLRQNTNDSSDNNWIEENGLYYYWKRIQVEWDTNDLDIKKNDSEYINQGYHVLEFQNYTAWKLSDLTVLGMNYSLSTGFVSFSGSTHIARKEKYNKDVSNLVVGASLGPEIRFDLPLISAEIQLGANFEYVWQPMDDEGGSQTDDNTINAGHNTTQAYFRVGLVF